MQAVHTDSPAEQPVLHDAHVTEFWEFWTDPARDFEHPATPHDHIDDDLAPQTPPAQSEQPLASKPARKPRATQPKKPKAKRPNNPTGSTFEDRDLELVRGVLIDRLDTVLLGTFDPVTKEFDQRGCPIKTICDTYGIDWAGGIELVQAIQLSLFPEIFGEPDDLPGLVPNAEEARVLLNPVNGPRFKLFAESIAQKGRSDTSRAVCSDVHKRIEAAVLSA